MELINKKVLLVGLGILGGGLSMAKYLLKNGAKLTITDLRDKKTLAAMISKLPANIKFTLGKHLRSDFDKADIIIFNPAVPFTSEWVKYAKQKKKEFYNDYTFFLENLKTINPNALVIGITGTRGKTTTSMWANHLIPGSVLGGNIPEKNLLKIMNQKTDVFVLELSSFQLEYATTKHVSPNISILTNVYVDHLNRYKKLEKYRDIKFNIFKNQTSRDALILNNDEKITKEALKLKPKSHLFFISTNPLPKNKNGLFFDEDTVCYQHGGKISKASEIKGLAPHEKSNLLFAMLAAHLAGIEGNMINKLTKYLPQPKFRQEVIFKNKNVTIINDSAGTNPDATMAAIEKYKDKNIYLITGGTNKELELGALAKKISKDVKPNQIYLLSGSATNLLIDALPTSLLRSNEVREYGSLDEIVKTISGEIKKGVLIFSPGAASFEKFKNEFDRGNTFNKLVKKYF